MTRTLVTGVAGFIGYHVAERLLARGDTVIGVDNICPYYDVALKRARVERLARHPGFAFHEQDIAHGEAVRAIVRDGRPELVVHLAAQAGVRYSLTHPEVYGETNVMGFLHILEACRHHGVGHLVYASSSSVYGGNTKMPFATDDSVDHPVSLYAATKKANELMAHSYSHLYDLPTTGLRFFTVYGPWGRPDMALFIFTKAILAGKPIDVFNHGDMRRDFTYIDDIVEGVVRVADQPPQGDPTFSLDDAHADPSRSQAPYRVYNIGNNAPVELMDMIRCVEETLGKKAQMNFMPMQPGDVPASHANVDSLMEAVGYKPETSIEEGVSRFIAWYLDYYGA